MRGERYKYLSTMPTFHYQAWDANQQPKSGELEAETVQDAIAQLQSLGLTLQSIGYAPTTPARPTMRYMPANADSARDVIEGTVLHTQLSKILEGAKTIVPALRAFSEELPAGLRQRELQKLIEVLERGDPIDAEQAFSKLPEYWLPVLSAALSSGDPGRILQEFIQESRRTDELRRQWWLMLAYPLFITCAAGIVFVLLSILIVPIFRGIFSEFGIQLPRITRLNLALSSWIAHYWPYMLIALAVFFGGIAFISRRSLFGSRRDVHPLFAPFGRTTAIARLSRFMADLLEAGLSIPDTLKVAGLLTRRSGLRKSVWRLADELQTNVRAANQLEAPPKMAVIYQALRSDIPTPSRIRLLRETADTYSEKVQSRLSWTSGVVEPAAVLMIGFVVASVVLSLFLPFFSLIEGLSG